MYNHHSLTRFRWSVPAILILLGCVSVLLVFIMLGQYAHPSADDYCMASGVQQHGLLPHLWIHYLEWSGRYTGNALYAIYPLLLGMSGGYPFMPLILILLLWFAMVFFLASLFRLGIGSGRVLFVSLCLVAIYLLGVRHPASSLYWLAGAMTYQSANILLLFLLGLAVRLLDRQSGKPSIAGLYIGLLLVLVAGTGTNEIAMLIFSIVIAGLTVHRLVSGWAVARPWLILSFVAVACSAIVYFSPGTMIRSSTFPMAHDVNRALQGSFSMGWWALKAWIGVPLMIVSTLMTPFAIGWLYRASPRRIVISKRVMLGAIMVTLAIPFVLLFPAWWSMGAWPPPRTVDGIYFIFMISWFCMIGVITSRFMNHDNITTGVDKASSRQSTLLLIGAILFVLAIGSNSRFIRAWSDLTQYAEPYHEYMQQRHVMINTAVSRQQPVLMVPAYGGQYPRTIYFNDIAYDYRDWRNVCYADYFELPAISKARPAAHVIKGL